eukprot:g7757.t1
MPFRLGNATVVAHRFRLQSAAGQARYLVVHGWGSNAAYISALCHALAEDGSEVVVLDLPGHGLSSGRSLHIRLAVDAIAEAERRFGPFDAAIGHSFGGASVMLAAGGVMRGAQRIHPSRLVVIGAPTEMRWLFDGFARTLGLGVAARDALIAKGEAVAGAALHDLDTVAIARRLGRPLLVVHAEDDKEAGCLCTDGERQGMTIIKTVEQLREIYRDMTEASILKVTKTLTPEYRTLIETAPFVALATVGEDGLDCSPRGDLGGVVRVQDDKTLLLPDWRGNNRVDSLMNVVRDPRVALMFLIPGSNTAMRINGEAVVSIAPELLGSFEVDGKHPRTVMVISIKEAYFHF